jgi:hypothetical protein
MQKKQQVRECWLCVIFFACVCGRVSNSTTVSDDPSSSDFCVVCVGCLLGGSQGGDRYAPPGYAQHSALGSSPGPMGFGAAPEIFFWVVFAIFSGFLN